MKTLGCIFMVAGTAIGGGMLAMPLQARMIGFFPSVALMFFLWLWMYKIALLNTELFLNNRGHKTLPDLAHAVLGRFGYVLGTISVMALFYSLLAAYTAGGSELLNLFFPGRGWIFVIPLAFSVCLCVAAADFLNRILFFFKIVVFAFIFVLLTPKIETSHLLQYQWASNYFPILPIFFTAFGFHGSIPFVVEYMDYDHANLKKTMFWGSLIPFLVYTLWLGIGFGIMETPPSTLGQFVQELSSFSPKIKNLINVFSLLAIATSYIGVFLGLFQFLGHQTFIQNSLNKASLAFLGSYLSINPSPIRSLIDNFFVKRFLIVLLTFLPAFIFGFCYPQGFIFALSYAAGFLSILAVVLPCFMALKQKQEKTLSIMISLLFGVGLIFMH